MTRLEAIARVANMVRENIEANGGKYDGRMMPNLQSVIDLCDDTSAIPVPSENAFQKIEKMPAPRWAW